MFTGIIADIGKITNRTDQSSLSRFTFLASTLPVHDSTLGASIACSGCCLTVVERGQSDAGSWFTVDVSAESLEKTTASSWKVGDFVNLEPALKMGDELGGHLVSGHVDTTTRILEKKQQGDYWFYAFEMPDHFQQFFAQKGSVTLDGISLTVNNVQSTSFDVAIIPHTYYHTTLQYKSVGDFVNLEVDIFARYMVRLWDLQSVSSEK